MTLRRNVSARLRQKIPARRPPGARFPSSPHRRTWAEARAPWRRFRRAPSGSRRGSQAAESRTSSGACAGLLCDQAHNATGDRGNVKGELPGGHRFFMWLPGELVFGQALQKLARDGRLRFKLSEQRLVRWSECRLLLLRAWEFSPWGMIAESQNRIVRLSEPSLSGFWSSGPSARWRTCS